MIPLTETGTSEGSVVLQSGSIRNGEYKFKYLRVYEIPLKNSCKSFQQAVIDKILNRQKTVQRDSGDVRTWG